MSYSRDPNIPSLHHHASIPYKPHPTRLQTLDIWLPSSQTSPQTSQPSTSPPTKGPWIIYVHGGAWRDPTQDSLCAVPTLHSLTKTYPELFERKAIAGIASINYRLSPYPSHATDPSDPDDPDRNVQHPSHVEDVRDALAYVVNTYDVQSWIGVGHSCGATLLGQIPLVCSVEQQQHRRLRDTLHGLVLLAGIYDVPTFLDSHVPPKCPENIAAIYAAIVEGAFGTHEEKYAEVSPARLAREKLWGRFVVLGYSGEDELVEPAQRDVMLERYLKEGWVEGGQGKGENAKVVEVKDLKLGHDEVWEDGTQVADLIAEMVGKLGTR